MIAAAKAEIDKLANDAKRANNKRALEGFVKCTYSNRNLTPTTNAKLNATIGGIDLRLSTDMQADENASHRYVYLNCTNAPIDQETARLTIEVAHMVLEDCGIITSITNIDYVDLKSRFVYNAKTRRSSTEKQVKATATIIKALWPTL